MNEYDITEHVVYPPPKLDRFDRFMSYLGPFCAGMGFLAALITLGIFVGRGG